MKILNRKILSSHPEMESMINARQASHTLCLPYYWFSDRAMRTAKRLPHYCLGGVVRFRLSELVIWANQMAAINMRKDDQ